MENIQELNGDEVEKVQEQEDNKIKLDYSITDPQKRVQIVSKIIENTPQEKLTSSYLNFLTDYIIFAMNKKEKKERKINTENRMVTINKRQTSFEGLVNKFENGEDGVYNLIINNDKNILLTSRYKITQQDIDEIPDLKILREEIQKIEEASRRAVGKRKYLLKKQLIQMRQDQYVIKNAFKPPIYSVNLIKSLSFLDLRDRLQIDESGNIINRGLISFFNPLHISILLCNYSKLKQGSWSNFQSDLYYLMQDLDDLTDYALKEEYPLYYDLMVYKIDGKSNLQIQSILQHDYGKRYSVQYLSSLWRNKIPKLIAEAEEKRVLVWYYTEKEKGKWKKCSKCGQIKLAHNKFFSKNNTSKDGFYSICKQCRNKKYRQSKE